VIFALGTLTTAFSFVMIGAFLLLLKITRARQEKAGTDAGKGV
jgi:putative spermidine/putrescine transport system permease protein